jgi:hypothetical protein
VSGCLHSSQYIPDCSKSGYYKTAKRVDLELSVEKILPKKPVLKVPEKIGLCICSSFSLCYALLETYCRIKYPAFNVPQISA